MKIEINYDKDSAPKKVDISLMEVYVLDFGDNYHRLTGEPTSEFEIEVRRLKGRYRDLSKFNYAMSIYNEWMSYLENKYGGEQLFKAKLKSGSITDYVPKKPRLKNIKSLKYFYKKGIMIGASSNDIIGDETELDRMVEIYSQVDKSKEVVVETIEDKVADEISEDIYGGIKRYSGSSFSNDIDYLQSYFMNKNKGIKKKGKKKDKKKKNKKKDNLDKLMITDIMNGYYDVTEDESENAPLTTYNGLLLSTGTTKDLDVYHRLSEFGWDSYKIMKKANYSKRVSNIFKVKKKKKKKNKYSGYDDLLIDIMTDNNYSDFGEFQKEMLDMTSANVFNF